ncbi:MAG: cysteine desulfurase, partial [Firmicutes bacterium]|nr:cysteine desulfurase [Bacillota bacterium]
MKVYADNAATTGLCETARLAMEPFFDRYFGNPSSAHQEGILARAALEDARKKVADALGAKPTEIYFTSGGTESDNWALKLGAAAGAAQGKRHIISSAFEHHAVLNTLERLRQKGFRITLLGIPRSGIIRLGDIAAAIRPDTAMVSIMYANNEIGTIQPVADIGRLCHSKGILFHTDAVQAAGHIPINVRRDNPDMLSLSGHKFNGPKGVGALFIKERTPIKSLIAGGAQEKGARAGTENIPGIIGMAAALEEAVSNLEYNIPKVTAMREKLITELLKIRGVHLNGDRYKRLPGNINLTFDGFSGRKLLEALDKEGICVSAGSACSAGNGSPSHVLMALGLSRAAAGSSLRIT